MRHLNIGASFDDLSRAEVARRAAAVYFGFCVGYVVLSWIVVLIPPLLLFIAFMRFDFRECLSVALSTAGAVTADCDLLFHVVPVVPWPSTRVGGGADVEPAATNRRGTFQPSPSTRLRHILRLCAFQNRSRFAISAGE